MFDGEGSIYAQSYNRTQLAIKSIDKDILEHIFNSLKMGGICGPYSDNNPKHTPYFEWRLNKRLDVIWLLKKIYPFMCQRRKDKITFIFNRWGVAFNEGVV